MWGSALLLLAGLALAGCGRGGEAGRGDGASAAPAETRGGLAMRVARASHSAVSLPDGRVLLIGGCVAESCEGGPDSATVDLFAPATSSFGSAGNLTRPRVSTAAVRLPNGLVLIAGGWAGPEVTGSVETFDPAIGRSRPAGALTEPRADIAAVPLPDGRVLLAGGYGEGSARDAVEIFDPADSSIRRIGALAVARAGAAAALLPDGRVLLAGGGTNVGGRLVPTESAETVDPATGRSAPAGSLAQRRYKHAAVALRDGRVLVLGGSDERDRAGKLSSVEIFSPATGRFERSGDMLEPRFKIGGSVLLLADGRLLIAGGARRAELYDPAAGRSVLVGPDLGGSLNFATASLLPGGAVLVAGGYYEDGIRMNGRAWILHPADFPAR